MTQQTFKVGGMKCQHCRANVENALRQVEGVSEANVDLDAAEAVVAYDESCVTPQQLADAVAALGRFELVI